MASPGVQVLLAFLLAVAFTNRFETLASTTRDVYFASVVVVAAMVGVTATLWFVLPFSFARHRRQVPVSWHHQARPERTRSCPSPEVHRVPTGTTVSCWVGLEVRGG